jgi:hypothetical protein
VLSLFAHIVALQCWAATGNQSDGISTGVGVYAEKGFIHGTFIVLSN